MQTAIRLAPRRRQAAKEAQLEQRFDALAFVGDQGLRTRPARAGRSRTSMISAEAQPAAGPSMIAKVSSASVAMTRSWPSGSSRRGLGAFDSGTCALREARAPAIPIGRLIQKNRAPVEGLHEQAADRRGRAPCTGAERGAQADRLRALARTGEHVAHDRDRGRRQHRAADRLDRAERDQPAETGREAAQQRAEHEHAQADAEDAAPLTRSHDRARQHQQAGDDERVGVDDPLQPRYRRVEVAADRGQRDVHDRRVEADDQQRQAEDGGSAAGAAGWYSALAACGLRSRAADCWDSADRDRHTARDVTRMRARACSARPCGTAAAAIVARCDPATRDRPRLPAGLGRRDR